MKIIACILFFLLTVHGFAQSDVIAALQKDVDEYESQNVREKLFVHTDKTSYTAGDILWFKVYSVDGDTHKPLDISKVSYVEILNRENKPLLQSKIKMQAGSGSGSFLLPFSLASDNYVLRAYTSWMKNFSAGYFFETPVTIINTLKKAENTDQSEKVRYDVHFFPEGGYLVNGLSSVVAFKGVNQWGRSIAFTGSVLNDKNDTVVRFQSFRQGMGAFSFAPVAGERYKAVIKVEDHVFTEEFPVANAEGSVMTVKPDGANTLSVSVNSNASSSDPFVYLVTHSGQAADKITAKQLSNGKAEFLIDKNALAEGITRFTVFNAQRQPLCERLYCRQPKQKMQVSLSANASVYSKRKKAEIQIDIKNDSAFSASADLSVSVYRLDSTQTTKQPDIFNYLWLSSEISGSIESPEQYLIDSSANGLIALDYLMLTQGWRRFRQEDVWQNKKTKLPFLPEYEGQIITAKITAKATGLPAPGITTYLSVPANVFQFSIAVSDDSGKLAFPVSRFFGAGEVILQTDDTTGSLYNISLDDPFVQMNSHTLLPPLRLSETWRSELLQNSIAVQTQNAYLPDERQHFLISEEGDTTVFYGKPDKRYLLDDYTRFPTMEEVMREYVTEVRLNKGGDNYHYTVDNLPYKAFFKNDPLVLLDGIPVRNTNHIIAYNPLQVRELDVITHKYYYGNKTFDGLVSYMTYKGDAAGLELNPAILRVDDEGLQLQREFYSPAYETPQQINSRLPDFRNTLLWLPYVRTGQDGRQIISFYTSDLPGEYEVVVQGNSTEGLPGNKRIRFTVQK